MSRSGVDIPRYALLGEDPTGSREELVHCETIAARSVRYDWNIPAHRHPALCQLLLVFEGQAAITLGSHGETMVPVPSRCKVNGVPLSEKLSAAEIEELVVRTRNGGAEVVALLKTGSAYYAPSAAAARMAKAVIEDSGAVMPVCAWVDGEYGISGVYLGVEAEIGRAGVRKVVETKLTDSELASLKEAAEAVRAKQADVKGM